MAKGRFWRMESVRATCVKHGFYTCGNNEEYAQMLNKVNDHELNPNDNVVREVAEDILQHSDFSKGLEIDDVLRALQDGAIRDFTYEKAENDEPDLGD